MVNKTFTGDFTNQITFIDIKGNLTRWIRDGGVDSYRGHFEYPISDKITRGCRMMKDSIEYHILDIIGDGTGYKSVLLDEVSSTGRINAIYSYSIVNGSLCPGGGQVKDQPSFLTNEDITTFSNIFTGDGSDGDITITSSTTVNSYAYVTTDISSGSNTIIVNTISGFNVGEEIMIIQTQHASSTYAGKYEFATIQSITGLTITLSSTLVNSYNTGTINSLPSYTVQIISVPNYNNLTINSGQSIYPKTWDGYSGGFLVFRVKEKLVNNGTITSSGRGFRSPGYWYNGESWYGWVGWNAGAYGNGGASGYAVSGRCGQNIQSGPGGAGTNGILGANITLSGGGGASGYVTGGGITANGVSGGAGAGVIMIFANTIINNNSIVSIGNNGATGTYTRYGSGCNINMFVAGGGGGGGGVVFLRVLKMTNSGTINTAGGVGGSGVTGWGSGSGSTTGIHGGNGGVGYVRLYTPSFSGSSPVNTTFSNNQIYIGTPPMDHHPFILKFTDVTAQVLTNLSVTRTKSSYAAWDDYFKWLLSTDNRYWYYYSNSIWNRCNLSDLSLNGMTFDQLATITANQFLEQPTFTGKPNLYVAISMSAQRDICYFDWINNMILTGFCFTTYPVMEATICKTLNGVNFTTLTSIRL